MLIEFLEVQSFDFVVLIVFRQNDIKKFDLFSSELIFLAIIIKLTELRKILLFKYKFHIALMLNFLIVIYILKLFIPLTILFPLFLIFPNNHFLINIMSFLILIFPINHLIEITFLTEILVVFWFLIEY